MEQTRPRKKRALAAVAGIGSILLLLGTFVALQVIPVMEISAWTRARQYLQDTYPGTDLRIDNRQGASTDGLNYSFSVMSPSSPDTRFALHVPWAERMHDSYSLNVASMDNTRTRLSAELGERAKGALVNAKLADGLRVMEAVYAYIGQPFSGPAYTNSSFISAENPYLAQLSLDMPLDPGQQTVPTLLHVNTSDQQIDEAGAKALLGEVKVLMEANGLYFSHYMLSVEHAPDSPDAVPRWDENIIRWPEEVAQWYELTAEQLE